MINRLWHYWKKITETIGNFQAKIILSVLYFILVTPIGLIANLFTDFLGTKKFPRWSKYELNTDTFRKLKDQ